ncbi:MAG: methyltransferase domain-containing protein [Betaproteobacteria bacterium]|nr:methyltransferase domain-containing protein [Betaproteobacteria bacterium]
MRSVEQQIGSGTGASPEAYAIDARAVRLHRERAAARYGEFAAVADEVGARMFERLEMIRLPDGPVLDLGCASGRWTRALGQRYPGRDVFGLDPSAGLARAAVDGMAESRKWWQSLRRPASRFFCADFDRLPLRPSTFSLIWSNLAAHWFSRPASTWRELGAALRGGGLLMFSCAGPDTLVELRQAWRTAGLGVPTVPLADMHDIGDALVHAGFSAPVMDMETLTLQYRDADRLFGDLRGVGATQAAARRSPGMLTPRLWRRAVDALPRDPQGGIAVTLEVVYGHAWWPEAGPSKTRDGLDVVRIHGLGAKQSGRR